MDYVYSMPLTNYDLTIRS